MSRALQDIAILSCGTEPSWYRHVSGAATWFVPGIRLCRLNKAWQRWRWASYRKGKQRGFLNGLTGRDMDPGFPIGLRWDAVMCWLGELTSGRLPYSPSLIFCLAIAFILRLRCFCCVHPWASGVGSTGPAGVLPGWVCGHLRFQNCGAGSPSERELRRMQYREAGASRSPGFVGWMETLGELTSCARLNLKSTSCKVQNCN